ncbi:MAG TPA: MerR family transcriptional regulator [Candidatus Dormibacteraeota bacterium]|nr:MerR family transcriptional regulator [Candidatus Dormibacteraeota bacterium]
MLRAPGPPRTADTFSIGEVASMVGLTAHTIRAWERRFAAVNPARSDFGQRRYSIEDVETLKRVKDLASSRGMPLRVAVAEALGELPEPAGLGFDVPLGDATVGARDDSPWRVVADLDPRLLLILDGRGQVFDANIAFAHFAGLLRFELAGRKFSEMVDPYDRAKAVAIYRGTPERRTDWELNLRAGAATGLYSFDCSPFRYEHGWLVACAGREVG